MPTNRREITVIPWDDCELKSGFGQENERLSWNRLTVTISRAYLASTVSAHYSLAFSSASSFRGKHRPRALTLSFFAIRSPIIVTSDTKAGSLAAAIDFTRLELAAVRDAPDPAAAFVQHVTTSLRGRFRFEWERKVEILAFLNDTYDAWRTYDLTVAQRYENMTIDQAQNDRALSSIAALGQAWWATGDERYGKAFERFYLGVPTGDMFNWGEFNGSQGSLELNAYYLLQDCPGFSAAGRVAFFDHLYAITVDAWDTHTSQWDQLGLGPEGHNWYLHGMHVLPFLGVLFPEFKRAGFFRRTGWSVVEDHVRGHLKTDGGARETTLGYQAGSMLCLWDFYQLAHRNGIPMSPGFADRLLTATLFLLRLASPQGGLPSFGDGGHTPGGLATLAAVATALTGDGECKWYAEYGCACVSGGRKEEPADAISQEAFWRVGLSGAATYQTTRSRDPHQVSVLFGQTGYVAMRSDDGPTAAYLAVAAADRGPIVTSHGHNDIFALDVHANGVRFLGEMGCAPYGTSPGRMYDQRTEAHNCLTVDGREQSPIVDEWRWSAVVTPAVRRWISCGTHDFFHGVEIVVDRAQHLGNGGWLILQFVSEGAQDPFGTFSIGFLGGELVEPQQSSNGRRVAGGKGAVVVGLLPDE